MAYGTINADVVQSSVPGVSLGAGNATVFKNRIINGDMRIDQRNAGASYSLTPTDILYTLDRWLAVFSQVTKFTVQQNAGSVTPPVGFVNYLGCTSTSAYSVAAGDYFLINQLIEGLNVGDLGWGTANAKTITISAWVYSSLTGTFGGALTNSAQNRSYPFTYTISSANTWTQISITIAGDTSGTWLTTNGIGIRVRFGLGAGSTFSGTAGSWAAANYVSATGATSVVGTSGATFYITGVQLEVGSSATGFEYNDYGKQLIQCQRYYEKVGWLPSEVPGSTAGYVGGGTASRVPGIANNFMCISAWQVLKRATPTILLYGSNVGATETSGTVADFYTGNTLGASVATRTGDRQYTNISTTTDSTYGILFRFTAIAEL